MTKSNSPQRCTSGSALRQNVSKSKCPQISTSPNRSKSSHYILSFLFNIASPMVISMCACSIRVCSISKLQKYWPRMDRVLTSQQQCILLFFLKLPVGAQWLNVEYLNRDREAAGSSLTSVTVLCP